MNILVTGANGQLGRCLQDKVKLNGNGMPDHSAFDKNYWLFANKEELDITNINDVEKYFHEHNICVVINCAAYTNVEKAENEIEIAEKINTQGAKNLALTCFKHGAILIHISTDYVFNGNINHSYVPTDKCNPLNVYGLTKRNGEIEIEKSGCQYIIFRTSWLYSKYGKNFVKTITEKLLNSENVLAVDDQIGSPTCANDLADFLYTIIETNNADNRYLFKTGIYHFANKGIATWYDIACRIQHFLNLGVVNSCLSTDFPSKVKRPNFSAFSTKLTEETFNYMINHWINSLENNLLEIAKTFENEI